MNGYIQIEINGEKVGLKFGYHSVRQFTIESQKNPSAFYTEQGLTILGFTRLIYHAYCNNQLIRGEEATIEPDVIYDWLINLSGTEEGLAMIKKIDQVNTDSMEVKQLLKQVNEITEQSKKKSTKKALSA